MGYDLIGDIHGHASELKALLRLLGYQELGGAWRHPEHAALFVGDFIDRGPEQVETVMTVRRMLDAGSARAVMGNHELNAIAWFTPDPDQSGEFLRPHSSKEYGDGNRRQHAAFLAEVEHRPDLHRELIEWFYTLPLWLDLGTLRLVHACWHPAALEHLAPLVSPGNLLPAALLPSAVRKPAEANAEGSRAVTTFKAVEWLTKGIEVTLPSPHIFVDKDGKERDQVLVRWWEPSALTFRQGSIAPDELRAALPDLALPDHARIYQPPGSPVFFGHYWLTGTPAPLSAVAACLDYSVAQGGRLCAYRFDGEPTLEASRFFSVLQGSR